MDIKEINAELIRNPPVFKITIFASKTEFQSTKDDTEVFRKEVEDKLKRDYNIKNKKGSPFIKEGLLDFNGNKNLLGCTYAKQTAFKNRRVLDISFDEHYIEHVFPSNMCRIKIELNKNDFFVTFFGGSPGILKKAVNNINVAIRSKISVHKTLDSAFNKDEMRKILNSFGDDVKEIFIAPGDSEKLTKVIEENGEQSEALKIVYYATLKIVGIQVKKAPLVKEIIDEAGISIKQVRGSIYYNSKGITTTVNSDGRIQFDIPMSLANDEEDALKRAMELYDQIIKNKIKRVVEKSLDSYDPNERY